MTTTSRDLTLFPEDDIGNHLWQRQQNGDDLLSEGEIEFSMLFPSQELALKFGQILLENNQKLSFSPFEENIALPWEITAYPHMAASYENIINYRALLVSNAESLSGQFDGIYFVA